MKIENGIVAFDTWDEAFVQKFGFEEAANMVLNYKTLNPYPFIYDTYQLAHFLRIGRKGLCPYIAHIDQEYQTITIPKRNGGNRILHAPSDGLRRIQRKILTEILSKMQVSPYATAYVKQGTLIRNAAPHVGKRYLLKLDITDFFGSIRFEQIYSAAFNTRYFPKQVGVMLTELCCYKGALPQGARPRPHYLIW